MTLSLDWALRKRRWEFCTFKDRMQERRRSDRFDMASRTQTGLTGLVEGKAQCRLSRIIPKNSSGKSTRQCRRQWGDNCPPTWLLFWHSMKTTCYLSFKDYLYRLLRVYKGRSKWPSTHVEETHQMHICKTLLCKKLNIFTDCEEQKNYALSEQSENNITYICTFKM